MIKELYEYKKDLCVILDKLEDYPERQIEDALKRIIGDATYKALQENKEVQRCAGDSSVETYERWCAGDYYGGLVGSQGGITTWINGFGRTGKYAIGLLQRVYEELKAGVDAMGDNEADDPVTVKVYSLLKSILENHSVYYGSLNKSIIGTGSLYRSYIEFQEENKQLCEEYKEKKDNTNRNVEKEAKEIVNLIVEGIVRDVLSDMDSRKTEITGIE